ncbi:SUKH-3 domain-containing protein [Brevibacillus reuszeri]|uniref:SUKH-3 domain-containing protein n=1 Tax=Brevibacillus reuszeri TaxID=54915 RepID=UPI003D249E52
MHVFSEQTINILAKAGWYEGREIDISDTITFLESKGYQVFPCVIEALAEYGGLECLYKRPDGSDESFHFRTMEVYGDYYDKEDFEDIERRVQEPLIAIGEAYRYMNMFMSESGKVYGEMGYCLVKFGDTLYEAIETLCLFKRTEEVD